MDAFEIDQVWRKECPSLEMDNKPKGHETPKAVKTICQREEKDSSKAERNIMSIKKVGHCSI